MPTLNLGKVRTNYRGAYNNGTTYNEMDSVYEGNAAYACTADGVAGQTPSSGGDWVKIIDLEMDKEFIADGASYLLAGTVVIKNAHWNLNLSERIRKMEGSA